MNVLLIGSGGREHALAWKLAQSAQVKQIFVAPGNGGTHTLAKCENVEISATDGANLREFVENRGVDLTIVGPEAPLAAGVVDVFEAAGLPVFGPTQAAAQLESSKAFSKRFMLRHGIPTGEAGIFDDFDDAVRYLRGIDGAPVIKADGLAAGKGVIVTDSKEEAAATLRSMLLDRRFGAASDTVLVEERLFGREASVLAFCDGTTARLMPAAQDHKRLLDGDVGPNTGGMGAYAPSPALTPEVLAEVEERVLRPALAGMAAEGMPYRGVLYAGLMLTDDGVKVLEFNCRFGDPEAQVILPLLESDLVDVVMACIEGRLAQAEIRWSSEAAATVVMASDGYPVEYTTGVEITGIEDAEAAGCVVFHAGTKWLDGRLLTAGGRVLAVTGLGRSVSEAAAQAYRGVERIYFNEARYRRDIGKSANSNG
jgi:phosphoribosylamine--glycine ligase